MRFSTENQVNAVILAGGQSARLYPFNKVLSDLTGSGRSLIQQAYDRLEGLSDRQIYVLTMRDMVAPIRKQLKLSPGQFFVDPVRRGTWPALLWAMAHLRQKNPQAVMAVVTGDHVIPKVKEFQKAFLQGIKLAQEQAAFVVIPVCPTRLPEDWTGFGAVKGQGEIAAFEEKPSLERAQQMIQEGGWYWNAGMFFFRIDVAERVLQERHPAMSRIYSAMADALSRRKRDVAVKSFESFPDKIPHPLDPQRLVDNTIDYAIMMPLVRHPSAGGQAWMTPQALTRWVDLGQWTALRQVAKLDAKRNVKIGNIRCLPNVTDCVLVAEKGYTVRIDGLKKFVIAFCGQGVLVIPEAQIPQIKELVREAREKNERVVISGIRREGVRVQGRSLVVSTERGIIR
jgi:mannose-1-phosphate guanylyltransferase